MLAPRELRVRYRQSLLDVAWALVTPVVILAVYGYILTQSFGVTTACSPYLTSAWAGLVVWMFFATSVGGAVSSLVASSDLITKVYLPKEAIPLSITVAAIADLAIGMATLLVLMAIQGVPITMWGLAALLPLAVIVVWSAAISVIVAVLATFVRDTIHAVHLAIRVGFFATPVMYEAGILPASLRWTELVNPAAVAIQGLRATLLCGAAPGWKLLLAHLGAASLVLVGSLAYTRQVESRVVDVL